MRPAFPLLLAGLATRFLALRAREVAAIVALALIFRVSRLLQRDGDRLLAAPDLAALSARPALQLAVLELVHDASGGLALRWGSFCHVGILLCAPSRATGDGCRLFRI